jgi:hypothetical protein
MQLFQLNLYALIRKTFLVTTLTIALPLRGYSEEPRTILFFKDGKTTRIPAPPEGEQLSDENTFVNKEEHTRAQERFNEYRKAQGVPTAPVFVYEQKKKRDPNEVVKFEIPKEQALGGCMYAAGYSYPHTCIGDRIGNEEPKVIFEAGKDPQAVLEAIKANQGITGEYNVVPEDYTADEKL